MMDPNRFWENQAVSLLRSVRRTLGGSATSRDVLAVVEDPVRLADLAPGAPGCLGPSLDGREGAGDRPLYGGASPP